MPETTIEISLQIFQDLGEFKTEQINEVFEHGGTHYNITLTGFSLTDQFAVDRDLEAGDYYVRVYPRGKAKTEYNLILEAESDLTLDELEDLETAKDLGILGDEIGFQEGMQRNEADYYRFQLTDESDFSLTLDQLEDNANVEILDNDGRTILFSRKYTPKVDKLLEAGEYYARVFPRGKAKNDYNGESYFSLTLDELKDDANLTMLDSDGKAISLSQEPTKTEADLEIEKLPIKNYVIQIYPPEKRSTKYLLTAKKFNGFEEMVYR
ncbi:MAG: hypothetical protein F6K35_34755 [Okeania sp. SIO2H7]|nr:hypothetical protein [Okeania sp. SIO2H7]